MSLETNSKKFTTKFKENLKKDIANLSSPEYYEIFNIIRNTTDKYSENSNGVFINLKYLDDSTLQKISDFIEFSKKNKLNLDRPEIKLNSNTNKPNKHSYQKFILDKNDIQRELTRLREKTNDNFCFQSFLDKLSVNNLKSFNNSEKINYPSLKVCKNKFVGVKARLLKKCREVNKSTEEVNFINQLEIQNNDVQKSIDISSNEDVAEINEDLDDNYPNDNLSEDEEILDNSSDTESEEDSDLYSNDSFDF